MNCHQAQQLLHLNRPGERSEQEAIDLDTHLAACSQCSLEQKKIVSVDPMLRALASPIQHSQRVDTLSMALMRTIGSTAARTVNISFADRLVDFFIQPAVRIATLATIVIAVGTFSLQYLMILNDIRSLESTMITLSTSRPEAEYAIDADRVRTIAHSSALQRFIPMGNVSTGGGRLRISEREMKMLLSSSGLRSLLTTAAATAIQTDNSALDPVVRDIITNATKIIHIAH